MIDKSEFGETGHESTRVIFGGVSLAHVKRREAEQTLEVLKEYEVNHIDTSVSYGDSELHIGRWMEDHREDFFLATKLDSRLYEEGKEEIYRSLDRLKADKVDLLQMHELVRPDELEYFFSDEGASKALIEAKEEGLTDFTGVTTHGPDAPAIMIRCLEEYEFDSVLLPFNFVLMQNREYAENFRKLHELCDRRGVALQTTKSIARRSWQGNKGRDGSTWYEPLLRQEEIDTAVHWVLSHPDAFLCSVGDIRLLPKVLDAADRFEEGPTVDEMRAQKDRLGMEFLTGWPRLKNRE